MLLGSLCTQQVWLGPRERNTGIVQLCMGKLSTNQADTAEYFAAVTVLVAD